MTAAEVRTSRSEEDTAAIGAALAARLAPGTFVLLHGDLGAGKTAFVRGLARGLGADPSEVSSPTFVLVQHYRGRLPLTHVDLYRLDTHAAVNDLGLEEMAEEGVVAIEWAERLPQRPGASVSVHIHDLGGSDRRITIEGPDSPSYSDR